MSGFASGTSVSVEKSRAEIETLVRKYGAAQFSSGWMGGQAAIQFVAHGRAVRFVLPLPTREEATAALRKLRQHRYGTIADTYVAKWRDAEERRRWRCLLLAIKAKLEVVQTQIATFEEEFLAHIVVDNVTVYDRLRTMAPVGGTRLLPPVEGS